MPTKRLPTKLLPTSSTPNKSPLTTRLTTKLTPNKVLSTEVSHEGLTTRSSSTQLQLTNLPKDIRFKIMTFVPPSDITKMCLVDKNWSQICHMDELWKRRVLYHFGNLSKPDHLTYKEYYRYLVSSGNLYVIDDEGQHNFIDSDVIKAESEDQHVFYVNLHRELMLHGHIPFSQLYFGELSDKIMSSKANTSIKLMNGIIDFFFSYNYSVFLTDESKLIAMGPESDGKFVEIMSQVKKLCSHISMRQGYGIITKNNDLYWSPSFREPTLEKIASDVTFVTISQTKDMPVIYYIKNNSLWVYYPSKISAFGNLSRPGVNPDNIEGLYELSYKHILLIDHDVKSISTTTNYLLVVDIHDELWIYGKDKFYGNYKYNNNYFDVDDVDDEDYIPPVPKLCEGKPYKELAGFDQSCYHQIKVHQISTGYQYVDVGMVDDHGNCYKTKDYELRNNDLVFVAENVISCFAGSNFCYIKDRFSK